MRNLLLLCLLAMGTPPLSAQNFILKKLDASINTAGYDEIAPCIDEEGQILFFTRTGYPDFNQTLIEDGEDLSYTLSKADYEYHVRSIYTMLGKVPPVMLSQSQFNQDIWEAHWNGNEFTLKHHPDYPLNNALPNSVSSFGVNKNQLILINQFVRGGGMAKGFSRTERQADGSWSFPVPLPINDYHNSGEDVNLTMSKDGKVIILSMERADGMGKSDLYISFKQTDGRWSRPENMGGGVNSPWRETTPHLSADGRKLYFASNRAYTSAGGSDIYVQERLGKDWKTWTAPRCFKAPVNSTAHDSHPFFNPVNGHLYFSSTRDGSGDIFSIQIEEPQPQPMADIKEKTEPVRVIEPVTTLMAEKVMIKKEDTIRESTAEQLPPITTIVAVGAQIELDPILFEQSTAELLPQSFTEIVRLADYLRKHPAVRIRISGHTDNYGDTNQLYALSKERAMEVMTFLVKEEKIDPVRLQAIGHGGELPVASNRDERGRKQNRRVEIEIIEVGPLSGELSGKVGSR